MGIIRLLVRWMEGFQDCHSMVEISYSGIIIADLRIYYTKAQIYRHHTGGGRRRSGTWLLSDGFRGPMKEKKIFNNEFPVKISFVQPKKSILTLR